MSHLPAISVLVLNWNGWQETLACLESVRRLTYPNARIVVIDNGSTDDSLTRLRAAAAAHASPPCEVLALEDNAGFAGGMNRGITHALAAGAEYVFLLNNDTRVAPDVLERLLAAQLALPDAGLLGCELRYPGSETAPGYALTGFDWLRGYARTWGVPPGGHESVEVDVVSGCAVLASRALIDRIGLMDDRYFLYFEDVDWAIRARRAGFTCLVVRGALVWHRTAGSTRGDQRAPRWTAYYYHTRNNMLLMRKLAPLRAQMLFIPFYIARTCGTMLRVVGGGLLGRKRNVAPRLLALGAGFRDGWRGRWGPRTRGRAAQL
ncbi:MAG TPA: glycosyltransferase family 2 protein [Ktedonobacterales bacterium]|jgi:GT2 family glycosyltransferase|nr:glycosyltransferase family 2 protein [Ktedonobacterales bacterium]